MLCRLMTSLIMVNRTFYKQWALFECKEKLIAIKQKKLPTNIILSANKELAHLPLDLNIDIGYALNNKITSWRFGGIFELPYNLRLRLGINSNNLTQRTENNLFNEIFGSSGIGIAYTYKKYLIEIGGYSYGTGGWIYGTGFNVKL